MQIVQFQVKDNKLDTFLTIVNNLKGGLFENVIVKNDSVLNDETSNYMKTDKFQEDKAYFQKCLEDYESGKTKVLSHEDVWKQIDSHTRAS